MDDLDRRLLALFAADPRIGCSASREPARLRHRAGAARQADLDRRDHGSELTEALGFPVTAFLTLEIRQEDATLGGHDAVARHLATIPEVLEAHTITGAGDLWARVVARSNSDLQRVIDLVLQDPAIVRSSTVIALATQIPYRVLPLAHSG
jgi:DNA-binding Lrp family transcriptional regulator